MRTPLVYLAGPIAGCTYGEAVDWRLLAKCQLGERGVEALNPMRAKDRLSDPGYVDRISSTFQSYQHMGPFFTSRGIMTRDHTDVLRADALLVNLLGTPKPSLGTVMELAWAYAYRKPAVVVIEREGNCHDNHPMLHEAMQFRVETLDEGIDAVAVILGR
jgi:nucleoside 2-deoxyribosyltransferase